MLHLYRRDFQFLPLMLAIEIKDLAPNSRIASKYTLMRKITLETSLR